MFFPAAFSEWSPKIFLGYLIERDEFSCDRDNYFAADKVFLFFLEGVLTISVIVETDEINMGYYHSAHIFASLRYNEFLT